MEGNQEMRHICRFCDKRFSCGRALGGHMRSHLTTNQAESSDKLSKKKPSSRFNNDDEKEAQAAAQNGYSLREKPKKTNKFDDFVEDSSFDHMNKVCKECGKKFFVWKSFFCHMKCHSDNNTSMSVEVEDDEYWNSADNEEETTPIRKQRSRIIKRYKDATITTTTTTTTTSYLQLNNASSSCVSEIDQEQEEVALSLILLSRDVTERSNAEFLEARITSQLLTLSDSKSEIKNLKYCKDSEFVKSKEVKTANVEALSLDSGCSNTKLKQYEYKDTLISRNEVEKISAQVQGNGFPQDSMIEKAKMGSELEIKKQKANKRKSNAMEKSDYSTTCFVESSEKIRSKFECTFCNKIFHSYQALGGHRASHKKMKSGCFSSRIDSNENSTETEISPNIQSTEKINRVSKMKNSDYGSKKNSDKVHQCPVCFKIFPSGQALGGHKRSHMLAQIKINNDNNKNLSETTKDLENAEYNNKKITEIRDFLDLNFPAPSEQDEVGESSDRAYYNPWWMGLGSNSKATGGFANTLIPETMIQ